MAGADYLDCHICGKRLLYDPDCVFGQFLEDTKEYITCSHCVNKLKKKIATLEKHDRRKH